MKKTRMLRSRPYEGQPHTDDGERGKAEVTGVTFRDLRDCLIRACCLVSGPGRMYNEACKGERARVSMEGVHDLPWDHMSMGAVAQALSCEVEKLMGIYPNIHESEPAQGSE